MMIDGRGILFGLFMLAVVGFIIGAIFSIWFGPWAMLIGALGLPIGCIALVFIGLVIGKILS